MIKSNDGYIHMFGIRIKMLVTSIHNPLCRLSYVEIGLGDDRNVGVVMAALL